MNNAILHKNLLIRIIPKIVICQMSHNKVQNDLNVQFTCTEW